MVLFVIVIIGVSLINKSFVYTVINYYYSNSSATESILGK